MIVQRLPSAVYHCDLPIKFASVVYESSSNSRRKSSNSPSIPAWPDIEDLDRWCCLPAFKRAIFMPKQSRNFMDSIVGKIEDLTIEDVMKSQYQGREEDIFSLLHEVCHHLVCWAGMYCAFRLTTQSDISHGLLQTIATTPQPTPRELRQLWNEFYAANGKLVELVQKFEIYEETFANFGALTSVPPEVVDAVSDKLWKAVGDGYRAVITELSMRTHELVQQRGMDPDIELDVAIGIIEIGTAIGDLNLHDIYNLDPRSVLDPASVENMELPSMLERADYYIISAAPHLEPLFSKVKEFRRTAENYPMVLLYQSGNSIELEVIATCNSSVSESDIKEEGFWESLRQQIRWSLSTPPFRVRRLICPYKRDDEPCCGREDLVENLWARLPKVYRAASKPPRCGIKA
jgi:hypothetical protein